MKPTILIRADANNAIGTGHVMRCLALAQAWQDSGGTACMAVAELPDALLPRVAAENISLNWIRSKPGSLEDAVETIAQGRHSNADWVVIDGDRFGSDLLEAVCVAGFRVLLIDDFANRPSFPVHLIVNPNLDEDETPYRERRTPARLLMGPSHIILRREFWKPGERRIVGRVGNRILVTLGGSDPEDLTRRILEALGRCPGLEITAIVGAGYENADSLRGLQADHLRVEFNSSTMVPLMKDSDLAIIAAGGTLWELMSIGCAVLSYSRNIVQTSVIRALGHRDVVVDLDETRYFDPVKLVAAVSELVRSQSARERMAELGRALVDGRGALRVVEEMRRIGAH
jgi:UDP-2,4-diacetamido-2,4,6-trideoxy-beta-L-altropyranose hydrolase